MIGGNRVDVAGIPRDLRFGEEEMSFRGIPQNLNSNEGCECYRN